MDLNEAGQRIFRRHWVLILLLTMVGLAVPVAMAKLQDPTYVAVARVDLGSEARGSQEANSLADTALALATSPDVMKTALAQAKVQRDGDVVAAEVQVAPVGTSGVLELSVTDPDRRQSAAIANALAQTVVTVREKVLLGNTQALLARVNQQYATVTKQVAAIEARIQREGAAPAVTLTEVRARTATLASLSVQHSNLLGQQSNLDRERQGLDQTLAAAALPQVIDDSATTGTSVDTSLPSRLAVGGLLGLIVGIALAAFLEAIRPTLDPTGLAHRFGAPVLGRLPHVPGPDTALEDPWLVNYVTLAAEAAGVRTVQVVSVGRRPADVSGLARSVDGHNGLRVVATALPGNPRESVAPDAAIRSDAGVLVVAPPVVKGRFLRALDRHLGVTRQPVIGVIGYRGRPGAPVAHRNTALDDEFRAAVERDSAPSTARAS